MSKNPHLIDYVKGWQPRLIQWREQHIKDRQFILMLSFVVGIGTALAALLLKQLIHWIQMFLTDHFDTTEANYLYLVYPVVGILLTGLFVRYVVKDDISHGVTKILYAISRRQGRIKRHNTWSSILASSITIGFGGSVGAEAPIVLTGSAIGSNLGGIFKMEHRTLMLLVGCGAAGAVAGIFKAPIAGLVFTLEVLMIDLTMTSLLPLLISSVTAATLSYLATGQEAMFRFHLDEPFALGRIPYVILLGIFCGLVSLYFTRAMNRVEGVFGRLKTPWKKLLLGGTMLSVLIFLFPPLYGEGYDTIELLLNGVSNADWDTVMDHSFFYGHGNLLLVYLMLIILFKVFASSATNGGGGCGGIFAPSLYLGCIAGFVFSHFANEFDMTPFLPEKNFALMGMAGVMSGVMHAPLTGVFLIAELTGGYDLFLPLMIVSVSSYLTIIVFEPHSIYSMRLAKNEGGRRGGARLHSRPPRYGFGQLGERHCARAAQYLPRAGCGQPPAGHHPLGRHTQHHVSPGAVSPLHGGEADDHAPRPPARHGQHGASDARLRRHPGMELACGRCGGALPGLRVEVEGVQYLPRGAGTLLGRVRKQEFIS